MSSNKYLSAFFTSAAALGGLYLLDRFLGGQTRVNPRRFIHKKYFDEFTEDEKRDIARRYTVYNESINSIATQMSASNPVIQKILEDQGCEIRGRLESVILARKTVLTDAQKAEITRLFEMSPNIPFISEQTQLPRMVVTNFLVETGLHHIQRHQELSDDDKEKLIAAKKEANAKGERLSLNKIGTKLGLMHKDVAQLVVLRLFAENGLNRPQDSSSSLTNDQMRQILSYFKDGEQNVPLEHIVEVVGVSVGVLNAFLFYNNIIPRAAGSFRKRELDEGEKDLIISSFREGKTAREISLDINISEPVVNRFINEYRASEGLTTSRKTEVGNMLRSRLVPRDTEVVRLIMSNREMNPPTSYEKIAKMLRDEKGLSITAPTVRAIHLEEISKHK